VSENFVVPKSIISLISDHRITIRSKEQIDEQAKTWLKLAADQRGSRAGKALRELEQEQN
jgi:hypothetical protein